MNNYSVIISVSCLLQVQSDAAIEIDKTLGAFADACNHIASVGRSSNVTSQFKLHKLCYREIRQRFGLSANLACRAIARVAPRIAKERDTNRKTVFRPTSIDYDARIFRFHERDWIVGFTLLSGRYKFALNIGDYQRDLLRGQTPSSATLVKRDRSYFAHIQIDVPDGAPLDPTGTLGVDMGIRNIATLSDGTKFSGKKLSDYRKRRATVRRVVQRKAAKSKRTTRRNCRRLLRRLSDRERRYQKAVNHSISKAIVAKAAKTRLRIAIEDLSQIRERTNKKLPRSRRGLHNSWAFYQLRLMLEYKAKRAGVLLVTVNPAYTSQICSQCGERGIRSGERFACPTCGYVACADHNGARNIAARGAAVNRFEKSRAPRVA